MEIPDWSEYFSDISEKDKDIKNAYSYLENCWNKNIYVDLKDISKKSSYIFYYIYSVNTDFYELPNKKTLTNIILRYRRILSFYGEEFPKLYKYCIDWSIAMASIIQDRSVRDYWIDMYINSPNFWNKTWDTYVTLGYMFYSREEEYIPTEFFSLLFNYTSYLTDFGKHFNEEIGFFIEEYLEEDYSKSKKNFLTKFIKYNFWDEGSIPTSKEYIRYKKCLVPMIDYKKLRTFTRKCENLWRKNNELPEVGKGWINETYMYECLKRTFSNTEVLQHARPDFLRNQHYDVFLPEYKIACEYQGLQHFKPVEFFGGKEGFENNLRRDKLKKQISDENGVKIIYVMPGFNIEELVKSICKISEIPIPNIITVNKESLSSNMELSRYTKANKEI